MTNNLRTLIMLVLFATTSIVAIAQKNETASDKTPKWISTEGFWVIESNIHSPKTSTVKFYNNSNQLVYSEKVEGVRLNIKRAHTCMKLKKVLDESLMAWNKAQQPKNEELVKNIFKGKE